MGSRPAPTRPVRVLAAAAAALAVPAAAVPITATPAASAAPRRTAPHWRVYTTIAVPGTALNDVVALPGGTAWAGGQSAARAPVLYHFAGGRWRAVRLTGASGTFVASLSGTSAANVWAAIASADAVAHLSSRGWSTVSFGPTPVSKVDSVLTLGSKDTWVFTSTPSSRDGLAHHFNGSAWRTTRLPAVATSGSTASPASASSPRNIWTWAYDAAAARYETMRYNGSRWRVFRIPAHLAPANQLIKPQRMLAVSPDDVWATAYTTSLGVAGPVILLHWQGHGWTKVTGGLPSGALLGPIARDGRGGIWLGAVRQDSSPVLLHYLRGTWTAYPVPPDRAGAIVPAGLSLIPGTRKLWGAGALSPTTLGATKGAAIIRFG